MPPLSFENPTCDDCKSPDPGYSLENEEWETSVLMVLPTPEDK